mmetsp:Transcript_6783/g.14885  ORF Transcript_6783/g.14885 Transcript_6783/m.14885 type:complete len:354 (+) Transcript_6783:55-1116(+)
MLCSSAASWTSLLLTSALRSAAVASRAFALVTAVMTVMSFNRSSSFCASSSLRSMPISVSKAALLSFSSCARSDSIPCSASDTFMRTRCSLSCASASSAFLVSAPVRALEDARASTAAAWAACVALSSLCTASSSACRATPSPRLPSYSAPTVVTPSLVSRSSPRREWSSLSHCTRRSLCRNCCAAMPSLRRAHSAMAALPSLAVISSITSSSAAALSLSFSAFVTRTFASVPTASMRCFRLWFSSVSLLFCFWKSFSLRCSSRRRRERSASAVIRPASALRCAALSASNCLCSASRRSCTPTAASFAPAVACWSWECSSLSTLNSVSVALSLNCSPSLNSCAASTCPCRAAT